jgi:hypothetical protein
MATHSYWGLLMTARPGSGSGCAVANMQMRTTVSGAQAATGGTASGTSTGGNVAANAFDANSATFFYNGTTPSTGVRLSYEFPTPVSIVEMAVEFGGAAATYPGATFGPAAMWVQWSDDGTNWFYGGGHVDGSVLGNSDTVAFLTSDALPVQRVAGQSLSWDAQDSGAYRVAGTVAIDGTPISLVSRRVRLFHQLSGRLVRETWSAADGTFAFEGLALDKYLVVTQDHTSAYDPVARDQVVAVP